MRGGLGGSNEGGIGRAGSFVFGVAVSRERNVGLPEEEVGVQGALSIVGVREGPSCSGCMTPLLPAIARGVDFWRRRCGRRPRY